MTKTLSAPVTAAAGTLVYRPDIDGLRAAAVLAVVIFHAFPSVLPGGFVGVDVFFVISGYLITGILLADLGADQFSVRRFYARRIRRIFPALVIVLLATYAMGWFSLYGDEFRELARHIVAGAGFVSNWALWTEAGYFDQAAEAKPLLHLWSLGVEEQFYIVWPLLLWTAHKTGRIGSVCAVTGLASFVTNVALVNHHPSAAFYWPITRMWELLAGAALAISAAQVRHVGGWAHALSAAGALLCLASFVFVNSQAAFPGWWALLPVVGAVGLIAAGHDAWFNRYVLARPVSVWFGRISYALYLWHWPLLSFAFIVAGRMPSPVVRGGLVVIAVALAWLTTVIIERPVRFGPPRVWKLVAPCLLMLGIVYLGGMTYVRGGLGFRKGYSPDADVTTAKLGAGHEFVNLTCDVSPDKQRLFPFCATDKRVRSHFAVWGDSKADALYWGLVRESAPGEGWTLIARPSCAPMRGVWRTSSNAGDDPALCRDANITALRMLLDTPELKTVVLVMTDRDVIGQTFAVDGQSSSNSAAALDGLDYAVAALEHAGRRVALVLDNPRLRDPRQCMDRRPLAWPFVRHALGVTDMSAAQRCAIGYREHVARMAPFRALIDELKRRHPALLVYDPAAALCDAKRDVCPMTMDRHYLYSYGDHLSDYGNGLVAAQFLPLLRR
ncbi:MULTISPECIES: acyltransferase family protein [Burkholderia cepacia complex]|uniref:Acyltransferase family protein n=1 Tax=Burkholderia vietnamiensis TaxID=60552 RepID=A0AAW7T5G9_BURVI|nr:MULTISPECIES: acyltransferase family protein [Burkholderia cepacia complex]EGD05486.1 putative O-antigen acetylase [Burkholderia sp. TJI49]MBR8372984.1 acyltransferase [Burkholderia cenocepacia]MBR8441909.1 acyltransferase [Burkholderia cenocepacia]MBU9142461.1 acyltransferase [Burkholderia multivorans]MBU9205554.1 acyltransferase [Burkholderia multivorans]